MRVLEHRSLEVDQRRPIARLRLGANLLRGTRRRAAGKAQIADDDDVVTPGAQEISPYLRSVRAIVTRGRSNRIMGPERTKRLKERPSWPIGHGRVARAIGSVVNETASKRTPNRGAKVRWSKAPHHLGADPSDEPGADVRAPDDLGEGLAAVHARLDSESARNAVLNRDLGALSQRLAALEENAAGRRASSRLKNVFARLGSLLAKRKGVDDGAPAEPVWDELRRRAPLVRTQRPTPVSG